MKKKCEYFFQMTFNEYFFYGMIRKKILHLFGSLLIIINLE